MDRNADKFKGRVIESCENSHDIVPFHFLFSQYSKSQGHLLRTEISNGMVGSRKSYIFFKNSMGREK